MNHKITFKKIHNKALKIIKKDKKTLIIFLAINLIFFGIFSQLDFATDTYTENFIGYEGVGIFLASGRIFTALASLIFNTIRPGLKIICLLSFLLAIFCLTVSMYELFKIIRKKLIKDDVFASIVTVTIILNPFILEFFFFIEKGIIALGILFCVIAFKYFVSFIEEKSRHTKNLIIANISLFLSLLCYQSVVGLFIVLATLYIISIAISRRTKPKKIIQDTVYSLLTYVLSTLISFCVVKALSSIVGQTNRINNNTSIVENIDKIILNTKNLILTFNIVPTVIIIAFVLVIILINLVAHIKSKENEHTFIIFVVSSIYTFIVSYLAAIAPALVQDPKMINICPRTCFAFASIFGALEAITIVNCNILLMKEKIFKGLFILTGVFLLIIILYRFLFLSIGHYNINFLDQSRSHWVQEHILKYEKENNINIKYIAPIKDKSTNSYYYDSFKVGSGNVSSFQRYWSDVNSINYYMKTNYVRIEPLKEWSTYCKTKDWNTLDEEQLLFKGETLVLCIY